MQLAAAVAFLASLTKSGSESVLPVLNSACLAMLMIALAGLFIGWWLQVRSSARDWLDWLPGFGTVAALWGCGGGVWQVYEKYLFMLPGWHQHHLHPSYCRRWYYSPF
jgi:uncharacterized membrane protein